MHADFPDRLGYTSLETQTVGSLRLRSMRARRRSENQSGIASKGMGGFVNRRWNTNKYHLGDSSVTFKIVSHFVVLVKSTILGLCQSSVPMNLCKMQP